MSLHFACCYLRNTRPNIYIHWIRYLDRKILLLAIALFLLIPLSTQAATLQRIIVEDTNNFNLATNYKQMVLPAHLDIPEYKSLRAYINLKTTPTTNNELSTIFQLTAWVHNRWQHNEIGRPPKNATALDILHAAERGEQFSCVEYSSVLKDALVAYGFVARVVDLQSADIAYAGLGNAHVAVEVYSNQLGKWIFLDPQWGVYLQYHGQPINIYEYHIQIQKDPSANIDIYSVMNNGKSTLASDTAKEYRAFIGAYLGFLSVDQLDGKQTVNIILAMQGKHWPMTFQGLPRNGQIFTCNKNDIYFEIDRVNLVMNYKKESQRFNHKQLEINSYDDYINKMPEFAAVPDFIIIPNNNMPWHAYYEYRVDKGKWQHLNGQFFNWHLQSGENHLEVRAVNSVGHKGSIAFMNIRYTS